MVQTPDADGHGVHSDNLGSIVNHSASVSSSQACGGALLTCPTDNVDSSSTSHSTTSAPAVNVTSGDSIRSGSDSGSILVQSGSDSGSILVQSIAQLVKNQIDMVAAQTKAMSTQSLPQFSTQSGKMGSING